MFEFLGVKKISRDEIQKYIVSTDVRKTNTKIRETTGPMLNTTRKLLVKFYRPYNKRLAKLLKDERVLYNE